MKKKVYIKPNSKHTVIASTAILEGSFGVQTMSVGEEEENGVAESKLFNWNSFDEF